MWCSRVLLLCISEYLDLLVIASTSSTFDVFHFCILGDVVSVLFVYVWAMLISMPTLFVSMVNGCNSVDDSSIYMHTLVLMVVQVVGTLAKALGQPILRGCLFERPLCRLSNRLWPCTFSWFYGSLAG